jgi:DNA primase
MWGHEHEDWVQRARAVPIDAEIQRRGIKLRRVGAECVGPCPKCGGDDRFGINIKKGVFNCRGCGAKGDIIDFVQFLDGVDFNTACTQLTGQQPSKSNGKDAAGKSKKVVVATFEYQNQDNSIAFVVDRIEFQKPDGTAVQKDGKPDKVFRQRRPDPDHPGRWIHNVSGVPVVPYRLPDLIEAIANDHTVLIVEGEAKADLLWSWDLAATCNAGGSKKWKPEHSEFLRGADVILLPDNDNAGWQHINVVGASLAGVAKRVRVLVLPQERAKGDIIDWARASGTREQFHELLEQAKDWKAPTEAIEQKTEAKKREDELIDALLKLPQGIEFYRR